MRYEIGIKESKPIRHTKKLKRQTNLGWITFIFVVEEKVDYHMEIKF